MPNLKIKIIHEPKSKFYWWVGVISIRNTFTITISLYEKSRWIEIIRIQRLIHSTYLYNHCIPTVIHQLKLNKPTY